MQYAHDDNSNPLPESQIKYIERVVGKLLYYALVIDNTMLHALNDIATSKSNATTTTTNAVQYLLDYAYLNPNAVIKYSASDMILRSDSDAAYLVAPEARSCAGGYHWVSNYAHTQFNGPVHVLAKVIKNVMASAMEAEIEGLYMNAQLAIKFCQILVDMGHPQQPTLMQTDSQSAHGLTKVTMKQKRSKAIDMRFHWLKDRANNHNQLDI